MYRCHPKGSLEVLQAYVDPEVSRAVLQCCVVLLTLGLYLDLFLKA